MSGNYTVVTELSKEAKVLAAAAKAAIPYLSRAYVFDNSGSEMLFLGEYDKEPGWSFPLSPDELPAWFVRAI